MRFRRIGLEPQYCSEPEPAGDASIAKPAENQHAEIVERYRKASGDLARLLLGGFDTHSYQVQNQQAQQAQIDAELGAARKQVG